MKHQKHSNGQSQNSTSASPAAPVVDEKQSEKDFAPSSDEVARRAYFSYVNEGSQPGREVQHWLAAEAELIAERNQTRIHGFHNKT